MLDKLLVRNHALAVLDKIEEHLEGFVFQL
jgi:hypothetical protein